MKKTLVLGAVAALSFSGVAAEMKTSWSGYGQVTAESGEGTNSATTGRGLKFGQGKVRMTAKAKYAKSWAKVQLDHKVSHSANSGTTIQDLILGYKCKMDLFNLRAGKFKSTLGMDANSSSSKLDIAKRGLDNDLVFGRQVGLGLNGNIGFGLSYNLNYFNGNNAGTDNTYALGLAYDRNTLHVEGSFGTKEDVSAGADLKVMNFGASYGLGAVTLKTEYTKADNFSATNDKVTSMYVHAGYKAMDSLEVVLRHYMNKYELGTTESDISNTFVGLNYWIEENSRIQLNYIFVGGEDRDSKATGNTVAWSSTNLDSYTANALVANLQIKF